jgi:hypothetical protein
MDQNKTSIGESCRPSVRKAARVVLLLGLSGFLLVNYQNCTPTEMSSADQASLKGGNQTDDNFPVSVIDDVKKDLAVSFTREKVEVQSQVNDLSVLGQCSPNQDGARLAWELNDPAQEHLLDRGFVTCDHGQFVVDLTPVQELECDHAYTVKAQLGLGEAGEVTVLRRCTPDAVADASAMKAHLSVADASSCVLEKREGQGTGCSAVCYDSQGVVSVSQPMDAAYCSN